jgi:hypothetical protein
MGYIKNSYMSLLCDNLLSGFIMAKYISLFNFVFILLYMVICDACNTIDKNEKIYIPLLNMNYIVFYLDKNDKKYKTYLEEFNFNFNFNFNITTLLNKLNNRIIE